MPIIEPVSTLSIKRAVNLYTIILFLSFGALLYWIGTDRYETFAESHESTAFNATKITAYLVNKSLRDKQLSIDILVDSSLDLLARVIDKPQDTELQNNLLARINKYQDDYLSYDIYDASGTPLTGADQHEDTLCKADIEHYLGTGDQRVRLHSHDSKTHYDVISKFTNGREEYQFLIRFDVEEISDLIHSTKPAKHSLMLINTSDSEQIELSTQDDALIEYGKVGDMITNSQRMRTLSRADIKGTDWYVVDIHDEGLLSAFRNVIIIECIVVFYIFSLIALFMRNILLNQDSKRTYAEEQLKLNHQQIKELNDQLELLSKTDSLTGLYNRRYFDEMINREWNRGLRSNTPLSCTMIDIDFFKDYNDHYGHQAGDRCLKDIATLMKDTFRRAGDIVARYGGKEFIVLSADSTAEDAQAAIQRFQEELTKLRIPHEHSATDNYVTVSAGIATVIPSREMEIEDFIRMSDNALYTAKTEGKNMWMTNQKQDSPK